MRRAGHPSAAARALVSPPGAPSFRSHPFLLYAWMQSTASLSACCSSPTDPSCVLSSSRSASERIRVIRVARRASAAQLWLFAYTCCALCGDPRAGCRDDAPPSQ